jgi:hypothetical protein
MRVLKLYLFVLCVSAVVQATISTSACPSPGLRPTGECDVDHAAGLHEEYP